MANLNKVLLMGNLTRDIELKYTPSGLAVARMSLATNRRFRDSKTNELREEVTFVDIDVFGKTAETAHQYLAKGRSVFVEGRLKLDTWDDKTTGKKQYKLKVVCDNFQFVGGQGQGGQGGAGGAPAQGGQAPMRSAPRPLPPRPGGGGGAPQVPQHDFASDQQEGPPDDLDIPPDNIPF